MSATLPVLAAPAAPAAQAPLAPAVAMQMSPADRLADMQAQKALNRLRVDLLTQEKELAKARSEMSADIQLTAPPKIKAAPPPPPALPQIISISGVGDKFTATATSNGNLLTLKAGDSLPGGWSVRKVGVEGVTLVQGSQTTVLRP